MRTDLDRAKPWGLMPPYIPVSTVFKVKNSYNGTVFKVRIEPPGAFFSTQVFHKLRDLVILCIDADVVNPPT